MEKLAMLAPACLLLAAAAAMPAGATELTAEQIVEKNVAARGGLGAWQKVQSMIWMGHVLSVNAPAPSLPFILEFKRPNKTRFEIKSQSQTAVRIYDGAQGWKLRSGRDGQPSLQSYTAEELNSARDAQGLDGPLMDYKAKGLAISLDGTDEVEGRKSYRLNVAQPSGATYHVWIDASSFLEVKSDRASGSAAGQSPGTASVFYRDYQTVEGLKLPFTIESRTDAARQPDQMVIDRVVLNQPLDDRMFVKPRLAGPRDAPAAGTGPVPPSAPVPPFRRAARSEFPWRSTPLGAGHAPSAGPPGSESGGPR